MGRLIPAGTGVASLQPHGSGDGRADGAREPAAPAPPETGEAVA